eukprot:Gb_39309 [translate_table: standard]
MAHQSSAESVESGVGGRRASIGDTDMEDDNQHRRRGVVGVRHASIRLGHGEDRHDRVSEKLKESAIYDCNYPTAEERSKRHGEVLRDPLQAFMAEDHCSRSVHLIRPLEPKDPLLPVGDFKHNYPKFKEEKGWFEGWLVVSKIRQFEEGGNWRRKVLASWHKDWRIGPQKVCLSIRTCSRGRFKSGDKFPKAERMPRSRGKQTLRRQLGETSRRWGDEYSVFGYELEALSESTGARE